MGPVEVGKADERREGSSLRIRLKDMGVGEVGSVMLEGQFSAEFQRSNSPWTRQGVVELQVPDMSISA
jgi:hypothetical protein